MAAFKLAQNRDLPSYPNYPIPMTPPPASYFTSTGGAAPIYAALPADGRRPVPSVFSPFYGNMYVPYSSQAPGMMMMMNEQGSAGKWITKATAEGLHLCMDMPGLDKDDVKVSLEHKYSLVVNGEGKVFDDADDDDYYVRGRRNYSGRFVLPENVYKTDEMKAEMKNGVLKVFVPKITADDVINVCVN